MLLYRLDAVRSIAAMPALEQLALPLIDDVSWGQVAFPQVQRRRCA